MVCIQLHALKPLLLLLLLLLLSLLSFYVASLLSPSLLLNQRRRKVVINEAVWIIFIGRQSMPVDVLCWCWCWWRRVWACVLCACVRACVDVAIVYVCAEGEDGRGDCVGVVRVRVCVRPCCMCVYMCVFVCVCVCVCVYVCDYVFPVSPSLRAQP